MDRGNSRDRSFIMSVQHADDRNPERGIFRIRHIFFLAVMLLAFLALLSYRVSDTALILGGRGTPLAPGNWIGLLGARFSFWIFHLFGLAGYALMALMLLKMVRFFVPEPGGRALTLFSGTALVMFGLALVFGLSPESFVGVSAALGLGSLREPALALSGGVIGQVLAAPAVGDYPDGVLRQLIGAVGAMITGWALFTVGVVVLYVADWHRVLRDRVFSPAPAGETGPRRIDMVAAQADGDDGQSDDGYDDSSAPARRGLLAGLLERRQALRSAPEADKADPEPDPEPDETAVDRDADDPGIPSPVPVEPFEDPGPARQTLPAEPVPAAGLERSGNISTRVGERGDDLRAGHGDYQLPPVPMLSQGAATGGEDLESIAVARDNLQRTLEDFGIDGRVSGYTSGPRVTRFEITLAPGVNVKKVESIADNIAMNLSAQSVRVLAPIPGRPVVGVEISNKSSEAVFMRSVMESDAWRLGKAEIPIALGKDVAGKPVVLDLAKAPHMLIAGSTGTGKSVCSNTLIMSLLFRFKPDELKLIMVDPKVVEFEDYKRLPHLLTPVINDSAKVPIALRWAVNEMEKRYRILARAGVKKISEYNSRTLPETPVLDEDGRPIPDRLPVLIAIIDELGDLMMTEARKDVENSITRIAQKGRAAGVHIVVATQRPSTNVITGVIKANLPTRLCFQVRSLIDSRVVLDAGGAEKLLGKGDMLYMSPTSMNIERVQGSFVPDPDIRKVVEFVCSQAPQQFNSQVLAENAEEAGEDDEMLPIDDEDRSDVAHLVNRYLRPGDNPNVRKALEIVILDRKVSTSYLQRRLGIGYNSAATIIDTLEERGVVGPASGSGNKRDILIFDGMEISE